MARCPVLRHRGLTLVMSNVILDYLARTTGHFEPRTEQHRWQAREWLSWENDAITNVARVRHFARFRPDVSQDIVNFFRPLAEAALDFADKSLEGREWLVGDACSIADHRLLGPHGVRGRRRPVARHAAQSRGVARSPDGDAGLRAALRSHSEEGRRVRRRRATASDSVRRRRYPSSWRARRLRRPAPARSRISIRSRCRGSRMLAEDAVALVAGLAGDVELAGQQAARRRRDLEMDVRRAAGIGDGLQRAEAVAAVGLRQQAAVALERRSRAARGRAGADGRRGPARRTARSRPARRRPACRSRSSTRPSQMQHRAHRPRRLAAHLDEIVVHVGGKGRRIERPLGLRRAWRPARRRRARRSGSRLAPAATIRAGGKDRRFHARPVYKQKRRPEAAVSVIVIGDLLGRRRGAAASRGLLRDVLAGLLVDRLHARAGPCRGRRRPGP